MAFGLFARQDKIKTRAAEKDISQQPLWKIT